MASPPLSPAVYRRRRLVAVLLGVDVLLGVAVLGVAALLVRGGSDLPEKPFLIHQFTNDMVDDTQLQERPGLSMVLNADGFGTQALKRVKYDAFTRSPRAFFHKGFKLFYREDTDLMSPRDVLRLRPPPDVVVYE